MIMPTADWSARTLRALRNVLAVAVVASAVLVACEKDASLSDAEYIQRAQELHAKGDLPASVLELKNALQANPDSAAARFLLGQIYVEIGDGASAEKELLRAKSLGMDRASLLKPLGAALVLQSKFDQILEDFKLDTRASKTTNATVAVLRGKAQRGLGRPDAARSAFEKALEYSPDTAEAYVGLARIHMTRGRWDEVEKALQQAAALAPDSTEVLRLTGDIRFARGDYEASAEAYRKLVKARPYNVVPQLGLARAEIGLKNFDQAISALDKILKVVPTYGLANYYRALAAFRTGDYDVAKTYSERVLKKDEKNLAALMLAGATSFALNEFEQANLFLSRYLAVIPSDTYARRLLGITLLRIDRASEALTTLTPLAKQDDQSAEILSLLGEAAVRSGDLTTGRRYLTRAVKLAPGSSATRAQLGQTRIALGEADAGIAELEQAMKSDPSLVGADRLLIETLINNNRFQDALDAIEKWREKEPNNPTPLVLTGITYYRMKNLDKSRASFQRALDIQPGLPDAAFVLSAMAVVDGDLEKAAGFISQVLKVTPGEPDASLRLARIDRRLGKNDEAISVLEQSIEKNPDILALRVRLGRIYVATGQPLKALNITQPFLQSNGDDASLLEVVGRAHIDAGQTEDAISILKRLVALRPDVAGAYYNLAAAYEAANDLPNTWRALRAALDKDPKHVGANIAMARLMVAASRPDEAEKFIDVAKTLTPDNNPDLLEVQGSIALLRNQTDKALDFLRRADKVRDKTEITLSIVTAQWRSGKRDDAIATLVAWLKRYPKDFAARFQLGNLYLELKRYPDARDQFADIVKRAPGSVLGRNNLAWTEFLMGDLDSALTDIEAADKIAPNTPAILDTLGRVLLGKGDLRRAIRILDRAATMAPALLSTRYYLALALKENDQTDRAKSVLKQLLSTDIKFDTRADAEKLLADLGG